MSSKQCSCGRWTHNATNTETKTKCTCGLEITLNVGKVLIPKPQLPPNYGICIYFGDPVAKMECHCGYAFQCKLLNKLCSIKKPIDEFVFAGTTQLNHENYQCCTECPSRTLPPFS